MRGRSIAGRLVVLVMLGGACGPRAAGAPAPTPPGEPVVAEPVGREPGESVAAEPVAAEPVAAEPVVGPADEDADGRMDADDRCPREPELFNDVDDDDGCPDASASGLGLTVGWRLELEHPRIHFGFDSGELRPRSELLIDELAALVLRNGHLGVLHVEAHTDSIGASDHNLELTRLRAETIRARLEARGVPPERIEAEGFGEQRPISHCRDGGSRCLRRVELWFERAREPESAVPSP